MEGKEEPLSNSRKRIKDKEVKDALPFHYRLDKESILRLSKPYHCYDS